MKNYKGNKNISGVREKIIGLIPKNWLFIEGFGGGAGIGKIVYNYHGKVVIVEKSKKQFEKLCEVFNCSIVVNDCVISYLKERRFILNPNTVLFIDPPYMFETRFNNTLFYDCEMDNPDHIELLNYARYSGLFFIIIHPITSLYDKALFDWNWIDVDIRYNRKTSKERIYHNLPRGIELLDYMSSVENFTKRQAVKRELNNMVKKLQAMSYEKRCFFLNEIMKSL
jgi:hypothetical protein